MSRNFFFAIRKETFFANFFFCEKITLGTRAEDMSFLKRLERGWCVEKTKRGSRTPKLGVLSEDSPSDSSRHTRTRGLGVCTTRPLRAARGACLFVMTNLRPFLRAYMNAWVIHACMGAFIMHHQSYMHTVHTLTADNAHKDTRAHTHIQIHVDTWTLPWYIDTVSHRDDIHAYMHVSFVHIQVDTCIHTRSTQTLTAHITHTCNTCIRAHMHTALTHAHDLRERRHALTQLER